MEKPIVIGKDRNNHVEEISKSNSGRRIIVHFFLNFQTIKPHAGGGYGYEIWIQKEFEDETEATKWEDCEFEVIGLMEETGDFCYDFSFPQDDGGVVNCPELDEAYTSYKTWQEEFYKKEIMQKKMK